MTASNGESWTHHEAIVNGVRRHWVEQGRGPLVVLLHGFPEFWYSWRKQIPVLAERFRVVAPDMRGYNLSEKPPTGYDIETLSGDVMALIRALGEERASVVGHDWGGAVAWAFAMYYPKVLRSLAILNAPHPHRFREQLREPRQLLRSSYMLFFQLPAVPELILGARRGLLVARVLRQSAAVKDAFTDEDLERYREAAAQPGALTGALNYYRAAVRHPGRLAKLPNEGRIEAPTLVLWGEHDRALGKELSEGLERWAPDLMLHYLDCGHWVQNERPDEVNRYLLEFLSDSAAESDSAFSAPRP